jgi:Flp pilus assembly pilin Flp
MRGRGNGELDAQDHLFPAQRGRGTSIEYALIAAGIAATIIATVNGLGSSVATNYTSVNTALK